MSKKNKTVESPQSRVQGQSQGEFRRVALAQIDPSPFQARKTFEKSPDWAEFVASVRTSGVVQPGVARLVTEGRVELVCGERRFRASTELGLLDMPLMVHAGMSDAEAQEIVTIENLQREGLNEVEEALGYAEWITRLTTRATRMEDGGSKMEESKPQCATRREAIEYISERIHRKRATIYERLRLTELTPQEASLLTSGKISASVASLLPTIVNAKDREEFAETLERLADQGRPQSVRQVAEHIEELFCKPLRDTPFDMKRSYVVESSTLPNEMFSPPDYKLVTCAACPKRTGNMLDQFPELKARPNVCTNPACYKLKVQAAIAEELEKAGKSGKVTLTEAEFNKRKSEFVRGDEFIYAANKNADWVTLMGKHAPEPVIVATKDGLRTVYPKEEAKAACAKNKVKLRPEPKRQERQSPEDYEKEQAELKVTKERREALVKTLQAQVAAWALKLDDVSAWDLVLDKLVFRYGSQGKLPGKTAREQVLNHIVAQSKPVEWRGDWDASALKLWRQVGVDLVAEEKKAVKSNRGDSKRMSELAQELKDAIAAAGLDRAAGIKAVSAVAKSHKLADWPATKTEADYTKLIAAFKTTHPAVVSSKSKPAKAVSASAKAPARRFAKDKKK